MRVKMRPFWMQPGGVMTEWIDAASAPGDDDLFRGYNLGTAYDEMFEASGRPRPYYQALHRRLQSLTPDACRRRKTMTDLSMRQDGVGFTVYPQEAGIEPVSP